MDGLMFLLVAGWVILSVIGRAKKRAAKQADGRGISPAATPDGEASTAQAARQRHRPVRPTDVDLPGQRTMPIHWEGPGSSLEGGPSLEMSDVPMPAPRNELRDLMEAWRVPDAAQAPEPMPPIPQVDPEIPGLRLELTGDALVKGMIYSEILGRRPPRRMTR